MLDHKREKGSICQIFILLIYMYVQHLCIYIRQNLWHNLERLLATKYICRWRLKNMEVLCDHYQGLHILSVCSMFLCAERSSAFSCGVSCVLFAMLLVSLKLLVILTSKTVSHGMVESGSESLELL